MEERDFSMKKTDKKNDPKSFKDIEELGRKYGVQVTNMADDGARAIGILGGVKRQGQAASKVRPSKDLNGGRRSR